MMKLNECADYALKKQVALLKKGEKVFICYDASLGFYSQVGKTVPPIGAKYILSQSGRLMQI